MHVPRASITLDIIKKSVHYSERVRQGVNKSKLDSTPNAMEAFQIESCVRSHHIYNLESARDYIEIASRAGKVKNFGGIKFGDLVRNSPIRQIKILAKISSPSALGMSDHCEVVYCINPDVLCLPLCAAVEKC